jgi:putative heme-binding domain-containing protein
LSPSGWTKWLAVLAALSVPALGDAASGRAIFEGKGACLTCHAVADRGGSLGPDLSRIGVTRSVQSLRLALVDPKAEIDKQFLTVVVTPKRGQVVRGVVLNEDDLSIQIRDTEGNPRSFLKDDVTSVRREQSSLMPSYANRLTEPELRDLLDYLRALRGPAPRMGARTRQPHHTYSSVEFLDRIGRDAEERPDTLIGGLEIPSGAAVAEIGSGTGYYTWRLGRAVGASGKVFAVDVRPPMLERTRETAARHQLNNIELVLGEENDPHLSPGSLDLIFLAHSYHEFSNPEVMLAAINRSLKPSGRLVVIEFAEDHPFGPQDHAERMTEEQIRAEIEPAKFDLDRVVEIVPIEHCLVFTKRF